MNKRREISSTWSNRSFISITYTDYPEDWTEDDVLDYEVNNQLIWEYETGPEHTIEVPGGGTLTFKISEWESDWDTYD